LNIFMKLIKGKERELFFDHSNLTSAGILEFMGARNQVGTGLSYRPARVHRLSDSIPWNRLLGSLNVYKLGLRWLPSSMYDIVYDLWTSKQILPHRYRNMLIGLRFLFKTSYFKYSLKHFFELFVRIGIWNTNLKIVLTKTCKIHL
jgi:hypothetical protein